MKNVKSILMALPFLFVGFLNANAEVEAVNSCCYFTSFTVSQGSCNTDNDPCKEVFITANYDCPSGSIYSDIDYQSAPYWDIPYACGWRYVGSPVQIAVEFDTWDIYNQTGQSGYQQVEVCISADFVDRDYQNVCQSAEYCANVTVVVC